MLHERLLADGIPCEPVSAGRGSPRLILELRRVIRRGGYEIVDAHNIQSIFWGQLAALAAGARGRVSTIHSDYRQEYSGIRKLAYPAAFRLVRPITREFIQVTEQLQEKAEQEGNTARSTLIPNIVEVPDSPWDSRDEGPLSEWGWSKDDFVVAVVGRLFTVKGQSYAIEAMAKLGDRPRIKLLLVGDGPQKGELEVQVTQMGLNDRVRFAGFRQDVPRILGAVDCVCLPSLWELLPYAALEAAAHALPIVATAVGGIPQLLEDRKTALLVQPGDSRALAAAIGYLCDEPQEARRLGRAAYLMVRQSYSGEEMRRRTLQVYDRAIA
jgi:glycosyltransferase involved in cell wall biosynthesis